MVPTRQSPLADWLRYLEQMHPTEIELGLERIKAVWSRLDCALSQTRIVTVAGTNGKGSTATLTAALASASGLRVGLYTSPHFLIFNERIVLDGKPIDDDSLIAAMVRVEQARHDISLTYFEFTTLAALCWFSQAKPDLLVLEVGLGGRLDAVNIVDSDVAVVTSVGLDHTDWLGDTLAEIAAEKSGVARPGKPLLVGADCCHEVFAATCDRLGARLELVAPPELPTGSDRRWQYRGQHQNLDDLPLPNLPLPSAKLALRIMELLGVSLNADQVARVLTRTRMPGRLQQEVFLGRTIWLDVAHNPQAAGYVAGHLRATGRHWRIILGVLKDKDVAGIVQSLAVLGAGSGTIDWHFVSLQATPRGLTAAELEQRAGLPETAPVARHHSLSAALAAWREQPPPPDTQTLICGSFYTVAEAIAFGHWEKHGFGD